MPTTFHNQYTQSIEDDPNPTSSAFRGNEKKQYSIPYLLSFKEKPFPVPDNLKKSEVYTDGKTYKQIKPTYDEQDQKRPPQRPLQQQPLQQRSLQRPKPPIEDWREQAKQLKPKLREQILKKQRIREIKQKPKLVVSETAWRPGLSEDETKKIIQQVTFILNKMTPEKYEKLKGELLSLEIVNKDVLLGVIDVIFDKAVSEHGYVGMYADLCRDLSVSEEFPEKRKFRMYLLNKCQAEFESMPQKIIEYETVSGTEDEVIEKQLKIKTRMIGTMLFIGELFKRKMLSDKIIHEVIKTLLISKEPKSHDIEVLCTLLNNIGHLIDTERAKKYVDFYFLKLGRISQDKSIPTRVRFQVKDLIELRNKDWESKKTQIVDKPTTTEWKTVLKPSRGAPTRRRPSTRVTPRIEDKYSRKRLERIYTPQLPPKIEELKKAPPIILKKKPKLTKEEVEEKIQSIMNIFLDDRVMEDAVNSIKELQLEDYSLVISKIIEIVSERSSLDRNDTCSLIITCRKENIFSETDLKQGFNQAIYKALETDLYFDVPLLFTWYGEMIGKLVISNVLSLNTVESILQTHIQEKKLPAKQITKMCSAIIREVKSEIDEEGTTEDTEIKKNLFMFSFNILSAIAPTKKEEIEALKEQLDSEIMFNPETVAKVIDGVNNNAKLEEIIQAIKE